ncbi:hypothetical protein BTVI_93764 [Pitangus sulphuratus]|nr:hypothetical protein BTVI_93764 [Pitangus sulphuratus]
MSAHSRISVEDPVVDQNDLFSAATSGAQLCSVGSQKQHSAGEYDMVLEQISFLLRNELMEICKLKSHDKFLLQTLY